MNPFYNLFLYGLMAFATSGGAQTSMSFPPLPKGVSELKFRDFFAYPVGPAGLTLTDKLKSLAGQRVRILGYPVQSDNSSPDFFLMTSLPVQLHDQHYGLADDLPAATLYVFQTPHQKLQLPRPGTPMLVSGLLSVGSREEADGRISVVRLTVDSLAASSPTFSRGFAVGLRGAEALSRRH